MRSELKDFFYLFVCVYFHIDFYPMVYENVVFQSMEQNSRTGFQDHMCGVLDK